MANPPGSIPLFFSSIKNRILVFVGVFEFIAYGTIMLFNNYVYKNELATQKNKEVQQTFAANIIRTLKPKITRTNHQVTLTCAEPIQIDSQQGSLAQIMTNLIDNALIHGLDGKKQGVIDIVIGQSELGIEIRVSDKGKGMTKTVQESIFDPFFITNRHSGGSGLGACPRIELVLRESRFETFFAVFSGE
jgi:signal transduction histidine kinase